MLKLKLNSVGHFLAPIHEKGLRHRLQNHIFLLLVPDGVDNLSPSANDASRFGASDDCPQGDRHLRLVLLHVRHLGQFSLTLKSSEAILSFYLLWFGFGLILRAVCVYFVC